MGGYGLVNISYACGHTQLFRQPYPELGEKLWCLTCDAETEVTSNSVKEWVTRCTQCRFARYSGSSKLNADWYSARHRLSTGHITTIKQEVSKRLLRKVRINPSFKGKL